MGFFDMGFKNKRCLLFRKKQGRTIINYAFLTYLLSCSKLLAYKEPILPKYEVEFIFLWSEVHLISPYKGSMHFPFTKSLEICAQCLTCNGFGEVRGDGRPCPGDWLGF